jgi:hypothetical protein
MSRFAEMVQLLFNQELLRVPGHSLTPQQRSQTTVP